MKTTVRHIEYLSQIHDCVIVNGLGAILAHHQQARSLNGVMYAPRRIFTFNDGLTVSDGLLESSIAREKQIDESAARQIVENDVQSMIGNLNADNRVSLGMLGTLQSDKATGVIKLVASSNSSLSSEWAWLPEVPTRDYVIKIDEIDDDAEPISQPGKPAISIARYVKHATRYAAAAIMLLVIGFAASTPISIDTQTQLASLAPTVKTTQPTVNKQVSDEFVYVPSTKCPTIVLSYPESQASPAVGDEAKRVAKDADEAVQSQAKEIEMPKTAKPLKSDNRLVDSDSYCVIIASLNNMDDALKCVDQGARQGQTYAVLEQGKRYRVYVATAPSKEQAQATLNSLAAKYPGAWICQR